MNLQEINDQMDDLSNYDGDDANTYTGFGDDLVDFGGNGVDFANEIGTDRVYSMTITNTTGATQTVILCPSYVPSNAAAVIRDGVIIANLSAVGAPKTIANFLGFIAQNPTSVVAFRVSTDNTQMLYQTITLTRKSPFRDLESEYIPLGSFTTEFATNDKMVTVRRPFQMDNQTELSVTIPTATNVTFTFYCGAVLNTSKALNNKSKRAGRNRRVAAGRALTLGAPTAQ